MKCQFKKRQLFKISISTPLTPLTLFAERTATGVEVVSISFGKKRTFNGIKARDSNDPMLQKYSMLLKGFLKGRTRSLNGMTLDLSWCTPFQRSVLDAARSIPWGSVVTYSDLAAMAGHPAAVRAAAAVMRNNRFPLAVPCHRVIASGGKIGGFMGMTQGPRVAFKRKLLVMEGTELFLR